MSNRRAKRSTLKPHRIVSVQHGTRLRQKKLKLRKLRQQNLASATRHFAELERRYTEGVTWTSPNTKKTRVVVRPSAVMAESMRRAREQAIEAARRLW